MNDYKTDVIYRDADGSYFYSPDGVGRIWFDSLDEAIAQVGDLPIVMTRSTR